MTHGHAIAISGTSVVALAVLAALAGDGNQPGLEASLALLSCWYLDKYEDVG